MTRDEALDVLKRNYPSRCFEDLCKAVDIAIKALSAQPEIIRCKDCKHWGMHKRLNIPWCFETHMDKSEDGYCDYGKRRDNE